MPRKIVNCLTSKHAPRQKTERQRIKEFVQEMQLEEREQHEAELKKAGELLRQARIEIGEKTG